MSTYPDTHECNDRPHPRPQREHARTACSAHPAQAHHVVPAHVGLSLRRGVRRCRAGRQLAGADPRGHSRRSHRLRHEPGGERLVRPPRGCDQRTRPTDPLGAHSRSLGSLDRHCHVDPRRLYRPGAWPMGLRRDAGRHRRRLGLFRRAGPPEAFGSLGSGPRGSQLRGRCHGSPAPPSWPQARRHGRSSSLRFFTGSVPTGS